MTILGSVMSVLDTMVVNVALDSLSRKLHTDMTGISVGRIPDQDIQNLGQVQKGMHSSACAKLRPNPLQETMLINFHRVLDESLER